MNILNNDVKKNWHKKISQKIPKQMIIILFAFFVTILFTMNLSWLIFVQDSTTISSSLKWNIAITFISSIFGMMNVATYSLYDPNSPNVNRVKIFIVFNTIAVISLAIVNSTNHLWFLFFENVTFFFTGMYQYYKWFIKVDDEQQSFDFILVNKYGITKTILIISGIVLLLSFFIFWMSIGLTLLIKKIPLKDATSYEIVSAVIDGFAFSLSLISIILVAKKSVESQIIFLISDIILIIWWLFNAITVPNNSGSSIEISSFRLSSMSLVILFTFYSTTNVVNFFVWPNLSN